MPADARAWNYPVDGDVNFSGDVSFADAQAIIANNLLSSRECTPRLRPQ